MTYLALKDYYEGCLETHGATHQGVDWPSMDDLNTRFDVMTQGMDWQSQAPLELLDVGCGPGLYLDYLQQRYAPAAYRYQGVDISPGMVAAARKRHPGTSFNAVDLIHTPPPTGSVDYAIFNGVFTVRNTLSIGEMTAFAGDLLSAVFPACRRGIAVNFMAPHADWYDEQLFYFSFDAAARLFKERLSRHIQFRSDYGLWEYTAFITKNPD